MMAHGHGPRTCTNDINGQCPPRAHGARVQDSGRGQVIQQAISIFLLSQLIMSSIHDFLVQLCSLPVEGSTPAPTWNPVIDRSESD